MSDWDNVRIELGDCTNTLLREIAEPSCKRLHVAKTYRLAMQSSESTDWGRVNRAIMARWSPSALEWIKKQAHSGRCFTPSASGASVRGTCSDVPPADPSAADATSH